MKIKYIFLVLAVVLFFNNVSSSDNEILRETLIETSSIISQNLGISQLSVDDVYIFHSDNLFFNFLKEKTNHSFKIKLISPYEESIYLNLSLYINESGTYKLLKNLTNVTFVNDSYITFEDISINDTGFKNFLINYTSNTSSESPQNEDLFISAYFYEKNFSLIPLSSRFLLNKTNDNDNDFSVVQTVEEKTNYSLEIVFNLTSTTNLNFSYIFFSSRNQHHFHHDYKEKEFTPGLNRIYVYNISFPNRTLDLSYGLHFTKYKFNSNSRRTVYFSNIFENSTTVGKPLSDVLITDFESYEDYESKKRNNFYKQNKNYSFEFNFSKDFLNHTQINITLYYNNSGTYELLKQKIFNFSNNYTLIVFENVSINNIGYKNFLLNFTTNQTNEETINNWFELGANFYPENFEINILNKSFVANKTDDYDIDFQRISRLEKNQNYALEVFFNVSGITENISIKIYFYTGKKSQTENFVFSPGVNEVYYYDINYDEEGLFYYSLYLDKNDITSTSNNIFGSLGSFENGYGFVQVAENNFFTLPQIFSVYNNSNQFSISQSQLKINTNYHYLFDIFHNESITTDFNITLKFFNDTNLHLNFTKTFQPNSTHNYINAFFENIKITNPNVNRIELSASVGNFTFNEKNYSINFEENFPNFEGPSPDILITDFEPYDNGKINYFLKVGKNYTFKFNFSKNFPNHIKINATFYHNNSGTYELIQQKNFNFSNNYISIDFENISFNTTGHIEFLLNFTTNQTNEETNNNQYRIRTHIFPQNFEVFALPQNFSVYNNSNKVLINQSQLKTNISYDYEFQIVHDEIVTSKFNITLKFFNDTNLHLNFTKTFQPNSTHNYINAFFENIKITNPNVNRIELSASVGNFTFNEKNYSINFEENNEQTNTIPPNVPNPTPNPTLNPPPNGRTSSTTPPIKSAETLENKTSNDTFTNKTNNQESNILNQETESKTTINQIQNNENQLTGFLINEVKDLENLGKETIEFISNHKTHIVSFEIKDSENLNKKIELKLKKIELNEFSDVPEINLEEVLQIFEINLNNINQADITNIEISIKVNLSIIEDFNISLKNILKEIVLARYEENQWKEYPAKSLTIEGEQVIIIFEMPGFSLFSLKLKSTKTFNLQNLLNSLFQITLSLSIISIIVLFFKFYRKKQITKR